MKKILGIELGSTRIKAVLTDENARVLAQGNFNWENKLADGLWSYDLADAEEGLRESYRELCRAYGEPITSLDAIGISAMMHGYLAFDRNDNLLAPFRTWRNTNAMQASEELTELFRFHVPARWGVSQFYQSVLEGLPHVKDIAFTTTLAGYIHYRLTGKRVIGIGDASGMFPIDDEKHYDPAMLRSFQKCLKSHNVSQNYVDLLPEILLAGEDAGDLTEAGARLLDPTGTLRPGCPLCPPEGDMDTGCVCTNTIAPHTANTSLGTSGNICVVLEKNLANYYPEIDVLQTPDGLPVALVHSNTCTSVIDAWVSMFYEAAKLAGAEIDKGELFTKLFRLSAESDENVGEMVGYNYLAGETMTGIMHGVPMNYYLPDGKPSLANFMQMQIYSAIATLDLGMDILRRENVTVDSVIAHGGYLKTPGIGQTAVSALVKAPVTVMANAGEGGAWGIAILALYRLENGKRTLREFLDDLFAKTEKTTLTASEAEQAKFAHFMKNYRAGLDGLRTLCESV